MEILLYSALAGIVGMGIGGLITVITGKHSSNTICFVLAFAGGIMIGISCFGLMPEAIELSGALVALIGLVAGAAVIMLLNRFVDHLTDPDKESKKIHSTPEELHHESPFINPDDSKSLLKSGILMLIAIALHNIPEGMAIGAGGSHDAQLGIMLAAVIAVHNIPEGMAIAAPLCGGGVKKGKILLLCVLSGATTLVGGALGLLAGISELAAALSLSAAAGAMLYVVFGEMIPQTVVMTKSRMTTVVTLLGVIAGFVLTVFL